jgi:uncharacterized membrane protein
VIVDLTSAIVAAAELDLTSAVAQSVDHCPAWLVRVLEFVQTISDLVGITAISIALVVASVRWVLLELRRIVRPGQTMTRWMGIQQVRVFLGNYILLGLEFMIVSDIIHSFLAPQLESLGQLGLLVVIRTVIGFFLGKELEAVRHEEQLLSESPSPTEP